MARPSGSNGVRVPTILRLEAVIQRYDWGSRTILAELRGAPAPSAEPEAELWLGAHAHGESRVVLASGETMPLAAWIEQAPEAALGAAALARFGPRLPFLFKILAVERALSLQAHPDAEQARAGFAREERAGLPPSRRLYADAHGKPELVVAHGRFRALAGFRDVADVRARLAQVGLGALAPPPAAPADWLRALLRAWLQDLAPAALAHAVDAARRGAAGDAALACVARLADEHPGDPGALAPLVLHAVELAPGEALHLEPGTLHCYLDGAAAEIMASSDNVLRAALTTKPRAVDDLLRIGRFEPRAPQPIRATPRAPGERVFVTPAREFELSEIDASGDGVALAGERSIEILLCHAGRVRAAAVDGSAALELARGESCVVAAAAGAYRVSGAGRVYRAALPRTDRSEAAVW
ncbi:MAG: mannose-6-phosphate isomerase, class I [Proteobacteria bacterium]|nr:MAG: mannose-6-phosphate isomerase, class I [Pseudomonadota bacterium]